MATESADPVTAVDFALEHAGGWTIYVYLGLLILFGWWAWTRYGPAPAGISGVVARVCRVLAILAIICLLTGPAWRTTETTTVPGTLAVAIDVSGSMARADLPPGEDGVPRTRISVARDLKKQLEAWRRSERRSVEIFYYTIGGGAVRMIEPDEVDSLEAEGSASALGRDLEQVLTNPADGLVILTDGRVNEGSSLEIIAAQLRERGVATYLLPVGTGRIDPELRLEKVDGPSEIPVDERQRYTVNLVHRNVGDQPIELVVTRDGEVLDRKEVPVEPDRDPVDQVQLTVTLDVTISQPGDHELVFTARQGRLESSTPPFVVTVSKRRLQVLLLAWGPRWEFRYLREALKRDPTVTLHAYLAEGLWRRWGQDGPAEVPLTASALKDYHAIILGDIPVTTPGLAESLPALEKAVRDQGSGLVWLPGEYGNTASFRHTDLGKLLPADLPDGKTIADGYRSNHESAILRTKLARQQGLLESGERPWEELPKLRGACPIQAGAVHKNARVLMEDETGNPIVIHANYGAGAALLIGVDDTWRWRRQVGDVYLHRYWSQLLRFVAAGRGLEGREFRVECLPYQAEPGIPVKVAVVPARPVTDARSLPDEITVRLTGGKTARERVVGLLRGEGETSFVATVPAPGVDTWIIEGDTGLPPDQVRPGQLQVLAPQRETRDPRVDLAAIGRLAETTNGTVRELPADLVKELPDLSRKHALTTLDPLWDRWWFLVLLVAALAIEWAIRRSHRLP